MKIVRSEQSQLDASIFYKLFQKIRTEEVESEESPIVPHISNERLVEEFKDAVSFIEPGVTIRLLKFLVQFFKSESLYAVHQWEIHRRKTVEKMNRTDVAVVLDENWSIPVLLIERKSKYSVAGSGHVHLHR